MNVPIIISAAPAIVIASGICPKNKNPKIIANGSSEYRTGLMSDAEAALYAKKMNNCIKFAPAPSNKISSNSFKFGVTQKNGTMAPEIIVV